MNATDLLAELRPPLDDSPADHTSLERILLAAPEPSRGRDRRPFANPASPPRSRYRRPLAVAAAAAALATAAVALAPTGDDAPTGLAAAAAALAEPEVLLHYKVTTTHLPSGATESAETWQTPDGRRARTIRGEGAETTYDQRRRVLETYVPERNEILVDTEPRLFAGKREPFAALATSMPIVAGDLPALLTRALSGRDPKIRHVGRTTIRGIDVDHIRVERDLKFRRVEPDASVPPPRTAPTKTVTLVRDLYVRHDNALPVRVVDDLGAFGNRANAMDVSEFTDAQKLTLDDSTERMLELADHPGAERTVRGPFNDSVAEQGR